MATTTTSTTASIKSQPAFNDKDMIHDLLVLEKDIVKTYSSYLIESSCPKMRTILNSSLKDSAQDQFWVFECMATRGWYPTDPATVQKLNEAKTKFNGIKNTIK